MQRYDLDPNEHRRARLRPGGAVADGLVHRARGGAAVGPAAGASRRTRWCAPAPPPFRRWLDVARSIAPGPGRRGHRRRHRVDVRPADLHLAAARARAGRARRKAKNLPRAGSSPSRSSSATRSAARAPGDRRVLHRPDDGRVGREDGQGERHHPPASRTRSRFASHHNAARAWKAGYFKDEVMSVPVPPKYEDGRRHRQPRARRHLARGARPRSSPSSIAATARSPRATPRR